MIETVLVAHGLWMPGIETALLRHRLQQAGFGAELFRFRTVRATLAENMHELSGRIESTHGDRIHLVGHSLGGVIAVHLLGRRQLPRIGRIVCLGSPLVGSCVADRLGRTRFGRALVGHSLGEHLAGGGLERWDGRYELGIIAGSRGVGFGRLVEAIPGTNDGTVAVGETRLPGATAHLTLPVTHTQMLVDRTVARQTIHFLRHGSFG